MNSTLTKNASHSFAFLPDCQKPRNLFDRSHTYKTTFDAGYMIPIDVQEILPGDTVTLNNLSAFVRLNPLVTPIMDDLYLEFFSVYVPNRLVWEHSKEFFGEKKNPTDTTTYLLPQLTPPSGGFPLHSVADYFALPIQKSYGSETVNALPFRAGNLFYNEWLRAEYLQNSLDVPTGDGPDTWLLSDGVTERYPLFRRGKRHDYFTSALPTPQAGSATTLPLGSTAPVVDANGNQLVVKTGVEAPNWSLMVGLGSSAYTQVYGNAGTVAIGGGSGSAINSAIYADLASATAASISEFRHAIQVQAFNELSNRIGSMRYTEMVLGHFGVRSPDARLQRPEIIAVASMPLDVSTVAQTSSTDSISPQGNLTSFGVFNSSPSNSLSFSHSFTEHGYLLTYCNVRANLTYQDGVDRMWSRKTMFDFAWPILSNTSEQTVLNKEIFLSGNGTTDNGVFGYQERYAEYRYCPSKITGTFRSGITGSLDSYHFAQHFTSTPSLSSQFIEDNPPLSRALAIQSEPAFLGDFYFDMTHARVLPLFGIPASLGVKL